ncbi:uncharacterized protein LOC125194072 [Salvia hispanica]|uniref:uncharacterized protein LOC125194072 n=1 Tax=Salvia hispanica TaxID=49212 RepID=UPI0020096FFB|nr:uncharacterized protein LOC125194072 [Salvia hispanica]
MQPISLSPSFNSHSNSKVAEIAARVVEEFASLELYDDEIYIDEDENPPTLRSEGGANSDYVEYVNRDEDASDDDEEFEFAFVTRDSELPSPISADEIFHNGQIRPVYPVFNRDLYLQSLRENGLEKGEKVRLPLKKLFSEERETAMTMKTTSSCSSSDADELDGVSEDLYCVWRPAAEGRCKKSSSAGSNSKRWKFKVKDLLLNRSHSEGSNEDFVILSRRKKQNEEDGGKLAPVSGGKTKSAAARPLPPPPPPPPVYGGVKRRSYLPYRQDLVGLFAGVNGLGRTVQPF